MDHADIDVLRGEVSRPIEGYGPAHSLEGGTLGSDTRERAPNRLAIRAGARNDVAQEVDRIVRARSCLVRKFSVVFPAKCLDETSISLGRDRREIGRR